MHNFFNKKRILSLFILLFCTVLLVGCGKSNSEKLWNSYVDAVNNQDLAAVAKTFYAEKINGTDNFSYTSFIDNNQNYFENLTSLKTLSYVDDVICDFSSGKVVQVYYGSKVKVLINGTIECELYMHSYSDGNGTFFTTEFCLDASSTGNEPDTNWLSKVYYTNDDFKYRVDQDNKATYIEKVSNTKDIFVPATIDGANVTTIGEYAFYKYNKILCFTIPTSKMKTIEISEGIETIEKYAFYQCKNLKEITIPESVKNIDKMAFASCTNVKKLEFQARTQLTNNAAVESTPSKENGFNIVGAHNLQTGEILDLKIDDPLKGVKWSVSSSTVLSLSGNRVVALAAGEAEITATDTTDPTNNAKVKITVSDTPASITIANDAFNRCNKLEAIYLHAYNPNSIKIKDGTEFTFNNTCKIYVPKGSLEMYKSHALWSKYSDNIVEMEESDDTLHLDKATEVYNSEVSSGATLNGVYSYTHPSNIDNILYLFNYSLGGETKNLIVDVYTGSYIKDNATAKVFKAEDYTDVELFELLASGVANFGNKTLEKDFANAENVDKINQYKQKLFDAIKDRLEISGTVSDVAITFEDMIVEVEVNGIVLCYTPAEVKYQGNVVFSDTALFINNTTTSANKAYTSQDLDNATEALYGAIVDLLITGNKMK